MPLLEGLRRHFSVTALVIYALAIASRYACNLFHNLAKFLLHRIECRTDLANLKHRFWVTENFGVASPPAMNEFSP